MPGHYNPCHLISCLKTTDQYFFQIFIICNIDTEMLSDCIKFEHPNTVRRISEPIGHAVVCNPCNFGIEIQLCEWQVGGVSCVGRAFTVDENSFTGFLVEDKEGVCDTVASDVQVFCVSGDDMIFLKQTLREVLPLNFIDCFKRYDTKRLNIDCVFFAFKSCFWFDCYTPPKYSLNCFLSASENSMPNAEEILVSRSDSSLTVRKQSANL